MYTSVCVTILYYTIPLWASWPRRRWCPWASLWWASSCRSPGPRWSRPLRSHRIYNMVDSICVKISKCSIDVSSLRSLRPLSAQGNNNKNIICDIYRYIAVYTSWFLRRCWPGWPWPGCPRSAARRPSAPGPPWRRRPHRGSWPGHRPWAVYTSVYREV